MIKVNKGDLALIQGSIEKWEKVVIHHKTEGKEEQDGVAAATCPLCCEYNWYANDALNRDGKQCAGCPILLDTGKPGCSGTPYDEYDDVTDAHDNDAHTSSEEYHSEALELAEQMLAYLKRLHAKCEEDEA